MRNLTSTRAEGALVSTVFTIAEGDSSSSFSETETDSRLSCSGYCSTGNSDACLLVAASQARLDRIRPYYKDRL